MELMALICQPPMTPLTRLLLELANVRPPLKRSAGVVERVLPGEGVEQGKTADELLLVFDLERVEVRVELIHGCGYVGWPVGKGPGKSRSRGSSGWHSGNPAA